jgi:hypothetical protein
MLPGHLPRSRRGARTRTSRPWSCASPGVSSPAQSWPNDTLVGGKRRAGTRGWGAEGNATIIAAVELDEGGYPRHVRFGPLPDLKGGTLRA